ncbi:hypothetical protein [Paraburkholderia ultramafica]|uniref:hypothetical protein n=1 Tax=Paraburkholderia ultramafica TaxID=1544867 RepID=UPI0015815FB0|nr:hypothetical protein [Paraburkholderia ultramafica]
MPIVAIAQDHDCGDAPTTVSTEKVADTKLGIEGIAAKLVGLKIGVSVKEKVDTVITQFPNADQVVLRYAAWTIVCKTIKQSSATPTEKINQYLEAEKALDPKSVSPTGIKIIDAPKAETERRVSDSHAVPPKSERITVKTQVSNVDLVAIPPEEGAAGWALRYLPSSPSDSAHQYFVIVKSVSDETSGKETIDKLRKKFPRYDFVLYDHFQGNPYMGIMMAAWVSLADAQQVLKIAKTEVSADSYIWTFSR